jgi:hypothetical protein
LKQRLAKLAKCELTMVDPILKTNLTKKKIFLLTRISISKKTQKLKNKYSNSRLAKSEKQEFTVVNDQFDNKHTQK